jgi:transcriptional regulator with XRE-family HTH domain
MTSKEYRAKMSLTLSDVSVMTGFHPSSICKWENGIENMPQEYVDNFKKAYSVDIEKQYKCTVSRKDLENLKNKYDKELVKLESENANLRSELRKTKAALVRVKFLLEDGTVIIEDCQKELSK